MSKLKNSLSTNGTTGHLYYKERQRERRKRKKFLNLYLTPYINIKQMRSREFNAKHPTIKFLKENIGKNLYDLGLGKEFLVITSKS